MFLNVVERFLAFQEHKKIYFFIAVFFVIFINNELIVLIMIKNIHQLKECPDCSSTNISYDDKEDQIVCNDCGLIFEPMAPPAEKSFEKAHKLKKK